MRTFGSELKDAARHSTIGGLIVDGIEGEHRLSGDGLGQHTRRATLSVGRVYRVIEERRVDL